MEGVTTFLTQQYTMINEPDPTIHWYNEEMCRIQPIHQYGYIWWNYNYKMYAMVKVVEQILSNHSN